jgi:catechol 2,3-dioxygenase-like lactoylglutathione lyase family enzyme
MLSPLHRIIIFVGDVRKCADFYRDNFGFTIVPSDDPPSEWMELDTGGCRLAFHQAHGPKGPIHSPTGGPMNPHKIVFYAKDVAKARVKLIAKGVKMRTVQTYGKLRFCDGRDPEGHVFQISNRK